MSFARRSLRLLGGKATLFPTTTRVQAYHVTKHADNQLIIGGLALASSAIAIQYVMNAYSSYQANKPAKPEGTEEATGTEEKAEADSSASTASSAAAKKRKQTASNPNAESSPFASWFAKNFYDGGFEEKMSKREAALILGVRESATVERIKEAHRRVLLLNHPDRGGSAHIAAKINEAKDLLLKGKQ